MEFQCSNFKVFRILFSTCFNAVFMEKKHLWRLEQTAELLFAVLFWAKLGFQIVVLQMRMMENPSVEGFFPVYCP